MAACFVVPIQLSEKVRQKDKRHPQRDWQPKENDYAVELSAVGVERIHRMANAFDGKQVVTESRTNQ
jgi:hypothetical protein